MNDPIPLPVYPHKPTGETLELLKRAKKRLNLDVLVIPVDAVPGSPGRILALKESPSWLCDHALVKNPTEESLAAALEWVLTGKEDPRATTVIKKLTEIFGDGVKEIIE